MIHFSMAGPAAHNSILAIYSSCHCEEPPFGDEASPLPQYHCEPLYGEAISSLSEGIATPEERRVCLGRENTALAMTPAISRRTKLVGIV
jgi:hypothetical protein